MDFLSDLFLINYFVGNNTNGQQISNLRKKLDDATIPKEYKLFYQAKVQRLENFHSSGWLNFVIVIIVILICTMVYFINKQTKEYVYSAVACVGFVCMCINTYMKDQKRNKIRDAIDMDQLNSISK